MSTSVIVGGPKRVAFDIGNVICHVNLDQFFDFLVEREVVESREKADEFVCGIQHPQDLGLYNIRQGFYRFNPHLQKKTLQDLHDVWLDIVIPSEPMLDVLEEGIEKGYQIALLSNIGYDHAGVVRQRCKVFQKCHQHFSCEVGARKPTKLYYQSFILQYGWPKDVYFFDDRIENIQAANDYLTGVQFDLDDWEDDEQAADNVREKLGLKK
jgi:FMN phosphatase YigB (HAD superfamily)